MRCLQPDRLRARLTALALAAGLAGPLLVDAASSSVDPNGSRPNVARQPRMAPGPQCGPASGNLLEPQHQMFIMWASACPGLSCTLVYEVVR